MADPRSDTRRSRRWPIWLGAFALLLVGLALVAPRGLEVGLTRALEAQGAGPVRLEVASLGFSHLELRDVQLGPAPNLRVGRLRVELAGPVPSLDLVAIEDLEYRDRRIEEPSWLETLIGEPSADDAPDEGTMPLLLPRQVRIERASARIETSGGVVEGTGNAALAMTARGGVEGDAAAELALAGRPIAELALVASDALVSLGIDAQLGAETLAALGIEGVEALRIEGRVEAPPDARVDATRLLAAAQGRFVVEGSLALEGLAGTGAMDVDLEDGRLALRAEATSLRAGDARITAATLGGAIAIEATPSGVDLAIPECLAFELRGVRLADREDALRGDGPWTGCITQVETPWVRAERAAAGWQVQTATLVRDTRITLVQASESLLRGRLPDVTIRGATRSDGALQGSVTASGGNLHASEGLVRVDAFDVAADLDRTAPARLSATVRIEHEGRAGTPLRFAASVDRNREPWAVQLTLREDEGGVDVTGKGTLDLAGPTAALDLALAPLAFDAETRQPEDYWPKLLVTLGSFEGTISGTAKATFADGDLGTRGTLELQGGGLHGGALVLEGGAGSLSFSNLLPLTSAPAQRLRFATAVAGVTLQDGEMELEIGPGWSAVRVPSLTGRLLGGRLAIDARLDLATERHEARIRLDAVDLGQVLAFANRPDLSGSGSLTGELPVMWNAGQLQVRKGRVVATPPEGRVQYRPAAPPAALAGAGHYGVLALQALKDFHYDGLEVAIDVEPGEDAHVLLSLRGANPAVQGGQPIHLNLDLSGPLLEALQADPQMRKFVDRIGREATRASRIKR